MAQNWQLVSKTTTSINKNIIMEYKKKSLRLFFALVFSLIFSMKASAQLNEGDIMFVGYNADNQDGFSVVTLVNIPANSTIYFIDEEWNELPIGAGGAFISSTETKLTWNTGSSIISAGTVITFDETKSASNPGYGATIGSISGTISAAASNEVIYAFVGTNNITPTTFLTAIANDGFSLAKGSLTNTGLTDGINATSISGDEDVMVYSGSTICNPSFSNCTAEIANSANWSTQDGSGAQDVDNIFPDFPSDIPIIFQESTLPIKLISFYAKNNFSNTIILSWKTATEIDNDFFTIERSKDGYGWEEVAQIVGAGNSSSILAYSATDDYPYSGISYYRLKQTDYDGQFSYSDVKSVTLAKRTVNQIKLYPNPTYDKITVQGGDVRDFRIYNMLNQDITYQVSANKLNEYGYEVDLTYLAQGVYAIKTKTSTVKVYKR